MNFKDILSQLNPQNPSGHPDGVPYNASVNPMLQALMKLSGNINPKHFISSGNLDSDVKNAKLVLDMLLMNKDSSPKDIMEAEMRYNSLLDMLNKRK